MGEGVSARSLGDFCTTHSQPRGADLLHAHEHHTHHIPPELAKLAYDDLARANTSLDMLIARYRELQGVYDERRLGDLERIAEFARELQPTGIFLSGPVVLLALAVERMVDGTVR